MQKELGERIKMKNSRIAVQLVCLLLLVAFVIATGTQGAFAARKVSAS